MAELDAGLLLGVLSVAAVFAGLVFTGIQIRYAADRRRQSAAAEMVHSFQSDAFIRAATTIWELPIGMSGAELRERGPEMLLALHNVGVVYETLGVLVHRRMVPLDLVQDTMGGAVVRMWQAAKGYVEEERVRQQRASVYEWWQWLAEQLEEHAPPHKAVGAHVAFRGWRP